VATRRQQLTLPEVLALIQALLSLPQLSEADLSDDNLIEERTASIDCYPSLLTPGNTAISVSFACFWSLDLPSNTCSMSCSICRNR